MRILYIDIDTLRPDHLGCYGYHRNTSPNIDRIERQSVRFANCYTSDAPCLPSRNAMMSGRFGIHTGVVGHGDTSADPFPEGKGRWFDSTLGRTSWMACLRRAGLRTVSISPFAERHSAWQFYANFSEMYNPGKHGEESADHIMPIAMDWVKRNAREDNWFLHLNLWDPHTPYRTPETFGEPFCDDPIPDWYSEEIRQRFWKGCGSWSAQEGMGYGGPHPYLGSQYPRQPGQMHSMNEVRRMFDGYDTGIRYADESIGRLFNALADQNVFDDLIILISSDHGENLGELNIHYDHQTADLCTTHIPFILRWPGLTDTNRVDHALYYQFDLAATIVELLGQEVPGNWDGKSFARAFKSASEQGRSYLVLSQAAHTCQRAVRFEEYICIRSYHDGFHNFPDLMLYDVMNDPHEQEELSETHPHKVSEAMNCLSEWYMQMMRTATHPVDPMWTVLKEGGPLHTRHNMPEYIDRLRKTGRGELVEMMIKKHPEIVNDSTGY